MLVLGIESSCDETAAAIVRDGRDVLSSVVASQYEIHAEYGGVVPELASRAHAERITGTIQQAIEQAGVTLDEVDAVAVGHRPGLIGALLVGVASAKALSWSLRVPLVGVDHIRAHLWAGMLDSEADPAEIYPALGLVVSGGHSSIFRLHGPNDHTLLGSTIDDAIGEAYDKAASILGLGHPGGPALDRLASDPAADDRVVDLPISRLGKDSLDFSFSGLKTALLYAVRGVPGKGGVFPRSENELSEARRRDLAASFQRAACRAVILKLGRANEYGPFRTLLVGGGVSSNSRLRRDLQTWADTNAIRLVLPEMRYCVDNAAMIAGLAFDRLQRGEVDGLDLRASPSATP